jgi:uncharacterized glyoxalase superfamily protein PhnB
MTTTPTTTATGTDAGTRAKTVWPCVNYTDARAAITFLTTVLGFTETIAVGEGDVVHHAELVWPEGGGVMLGSAGRQESEFSQKPVGAASVYVVTDDPDRLYRQATSAGARIVQDLEDTDYGSRTFSLADPEGNLWSFGTYRGA